VIGKGSFGKVFLVRPNWLLAGDSTVYAMKVSLSHLTPTFFFQIISTL